MGKFSPVKLDEENVVFVQIPGGLAFTRSRGYALSNEEIERLPTVASEVARVKSQYHEVGRTGAHVLYLDTKDGKIYSTERDHPVDDHKDFQPLPDHLLPRIQELKAKLTQGRSEPSVPPGQEYKQ